MNRCPIFTIVTIVLFANILCLSSAIAQDNYPVPAKTEKLLFYFQRSHNRNTIIYEINTLPSGQIDCEKPINYYWIRYEEAGVRKELSFIQRKAFGLDWQLIDKAKMSFVLHFNNFKNRAIYLMKTEGAASYKAYTSINGELSELSKMYIKSENNSLGIPLSVKYVELSGISLKAGKSVTERYIPKS